MENKAIKRILTGLTVVLMAIGVIVSAISIKHGDIPGDRETKQLGIIAYNAEATECQCNPEKSVDDFEKEELDRVMGNIIGATSTSVGWALILTCLTVAIWVIFIILGFVKNPKGIVKIAVTFGGFILLLVIIYFTTAAEQIPESLSEALTRNSVQHDIGGYNLASWGIATSIVLIVLAVLSWIGGGIYSMVKK